jgi:hypothetical protein
MSQRCRATESLDGGRTLAKKPDSTLALLGRNGVVTDDLANLMDLFKLLTGSGALSHERMMERLAWRERCSTF